MPGRSICCWATKGKLVSVDKVAGGGSIADWHRGLLLAAAVMTYLSIVMGGVVCVTGSTLGCPDWPGCYGRLIPPLRTDAIIEVSHRLVAALASLLILGAAITGWRRARAVRWVRWPPMVALLFLLVVSALGALTVLRGLSPVLAAVDLASALIVQALLAASTAVAFARRPATPGGDRLSFPSSFAKLTLWTLGAVFLVLVSAVLVAEDGSLERCLGWPLYGGGWAAATTGGWPTAVRRILAALAGLLILALVVGAWRTQRGRLAVLRAATLVGVLFLVEMLLGLLIVAHGSALALLVPHVAVGAALWAMLVALAVQAGLASPTSSAARAGPSPPAGLAK